MAKALSDHLSNPLQATPSDTINNVYNSMYNQASQRTNCMPSSEDELGQWSAQERYQEHINLIVHRQQNTSKVISAAPRRVDLDEDMSDDELAQPYREELKIISPQKELGFQVEVQPDEDYEQAQDRFDQGDGLVMGGHEELDEAYYDDLADYPVEDDEMFDKHDFLKSPLTPSLSSPFTSPQSSRPPSPDESKTLYARLLEEQGEIQDEMNALYKSVPDLKGQYQLLDRLGTGTFSSVYKAIDLSYDDWDNSPWLGNHPPESTAFYQSAGPHYKGRGGRGIKKRSANTSGDVDVDMDAGANASRDGNVYVAIKRIYTTSAPERIRNELSILETCRGCRHASQIITAFRHEDQVTIVLPYQRHSDFREYYQSLHPEGIKCYFRCLFRALRDVHARGIIHRDVKPANFLYDPFTGIGTLCDFGLASCMEPEPRPCTPGRCLHTAPSTDFPHGKNCTIDDNQRMLVKNAQKEARSKSILPAEKVGYPENDKRPVSKANRAGTRGFRAPEVLFKCHGQTGAIDVWSAGIIFLCFLTGKFPIFQSNDDIEALMEIASILGRKKTERAATLHGRTFATNVPDLQPQGISWQEFVERLRPDIMTPPKYDMRFYPHNCKHRDGNNTSSTMLSPPVPPSSSPPPASDAPSLDALSSVLHATTNATSDRYLNPPSVERHTKDIRNAFDLLEVMLHFESTKRIIARDVLYHAFLSEPGVDPQTEGDDVFAPHPPGEGECAAFHARDDAAEEMYVAIMKNLEDVEGEEDDPDAEALWEGVDLSDLSKLEVVDKGGQRWVKFWKRCMPGQGTAIGKRPCEFHRGPPYGFE